MLSPLFAMQVSEHAIGSRALLIPIFGILGVFLFLPGMIVLLSYLINRNRHEERLRMIEKGLPIPIPPYDPMRTARRIRLAGLIFLMLGIGIALTGLGRQERMEVGGPVSIEVPGGPSIHVPEGRGAFGGHRGGVAGGAIPFMIGVGLLLDYRFRVKELRRGESTAPTGGNLPPAEHSGV